MGFVNVARGVRAIGYLERDPLPAGPIALVTHSGSVFSALLRTHRRLEYSLAVSSGQELVTTTADYLGYALSQPETRVVGLVLETLRDAPALRASLALAAERDVPVVALTVGSSARGPGPRRRALGRPGRVRRGVGGAVRGVRRAPLRRPRRAGRQPGVLRDRPAGTAPRRAASRPCTTPAPSGSWPPTWPSGSASRSRPSRTATTARLAALLEPGLAATNPLDVWGTGAGTADLVPDCLTALADDDAVDVVALAVDLVPEYDGDDAFPRALRRLAAYTDKPVAVLANLSSAIDQPLAAELRAEGIPVLEGTRSGLRALGHLLAQADADRPDRPTGRRRRTTTVHVVRAPRRGRRRRDGAPRRLRDPAWSPAGPATTRRARWRPPTSSATPSCSRPPPPTSTTRSTRTASGSASTTRTPSGRRTPISRRGWVRG